MAFCALVHSFFPDALTTTRRSSHTAAAELRAGLHHGRVSLGSQARLLWKPQLLNSRKLSNICLGDISDFSSGSILLP